MLCLLLTCAGRSTTAECAIKTLRMSDLSRNVAAKHASFLCCSLCEWSFRQKAARTGYAVISDAVHTKRAHADPCVVGTELYCCSSGRSSILSGLVSQHWKDSQFTFGARVVIHGKCKSRRRFAFSEQAASLTERDNRLAHYFGLFGVWDYFLGYLATSRAKSDFIFLLGYPDFLQMRRNFAPILPSFRDLTRDRQTNDRRGDRNSVRA